MSRKFDGGFAPRLIAVLFLAAPAVAAADPHELVIDLAPFAPFGVIGEFIGVGTQEGVVENARLDVTFEVTDTGPWSFGGAFQFVNGGSIGFSSVLEGWSGTGTFSTSVENDTFNGPLEIPDGQPWWSWLMSWSGGSPFVLPSGGQGMGPIDGVFTEFKLTLTLAACPNGDVDLPWEDLGNALAGSSGLPVLSGTGSLCSSELATLRLENAFAGGATALVLGLSTVDAPLLGGTLVPSTDVIVFGLPIDGNGVHELTFTWPPSIPSGFTFYAQHWFADPGVFGFAASNGLRACAP